MDPYLERYWGDVHQTLITYSRDALQSALPRSLLARTEERVFLMEEGEDQPRFRVPDTFIYEDPSPSWKGSSGGAALAEPDAEIARTILFKCKEDITEGYIEIRERDGGKVITVIEFLSPTNKYPGPGRDKYDAERAEILRFDTSLVEIDLVRAGPRNLAIGDARIQEDFRTDFLVCTKIGWQREDLRLGVLPLREKLKAVRIPLRKGETPVVLSLQPLIDKVYEMGRYDVIDYSKPCQPPLESDDAFWAGKLVTGWSAQALLPAQ
jgi:hypothetical protein